MNWDWTLIFYAYIGVALYDIAKGLVLLAIKKLG